MPILERMKNDFPLSTDWSLSRMENIRAWLVPLSQIFQTRELALLAFEIRQAATSIIDFDQARVLADHESSDEEETPAVPQALSPKSSLPDPPPPASMRPIRATRNKAGKDDHIGNTVGASDTLTIPVSDSTIRVKRPIRVKKVLEKVGGQEEMEFSHKVRTPQDFSFCQFYFFLFSAIFVQTRILLVSVPSAVQVWFARPALTVKRSVRFQKSAHLSSRTNRPRRPLQAKNARRWRSLPKSLLLLFLFLLSTLLLTKNRLLPLS